MESLKRLGSITNSHYDESLPLPSLLSSSAASELLMSSQQSENHSLSTINSQNNDVIRSTSGDGRTIVESIHQQQSQYIHHALSSANNRHRRSLTDHINRRIVKRNFPNNQLSKASDEMDEDDSNEAELDGMDDGENDDDYVEGESEGSSNRRQQTQEKNNLNRQDRLDENDNENDLGKSMEMLVPYWDAYDTVNQLFLEISKYDQ